MSDHRDNLKSIANDLRALGDASSKAFRNRVAAEIFVRLVCDQSDSRTVEEVARYSADAAIMLAKELGR